MTPYADFVYYQGTYLGDKIPDEASFKRLALRASTYLDHVTFEAVKTYDPADAVKDACCAVAEAWQEQEQTGNLASETVGPWSKTFRSDGGLMYTASLFDAARLYLPDIVRSARWI